MVLGKGVIKPGQGMCFGLLLSNDGVVRAWATQHIHQLRCVGSVQPGVLLQPENLGADKAIVLRQKSQQHGRNGALVGWVEIEGVGAHLQVLGIGCLHDEKTAGHQHAKGMLH